MDTTTTSPDSNLLERLARYLSASPADPYLDECATQATALVHHHCGNRLEAVPGPVLERAILEVAATLWHRRTALAGVAGFDDTDTTPAPVPAPRNPLANAYPLLRPWLGVGIA